MVNQIAANITIEVLAEKVDRLQSDLVDERIMHDGLKKEYTFLADKYARMLSTVHSTVTAMQICAKPMPDDPDEIKAWRWSVGELVNGLKKDVLGIEPAQQESRKSQA